MMTKEEEEQLRKLGIEKNIFNLIKGISEKDVTILNGKILKTLTSFVNITFSGEILKTFVLKLRTGKYFYSNPFLLSISVEFKAMKH